MPDFTTIRTGGSATDKATLDASETITRCSPPRS